MKSIDNFRCEKKQSHGKSTFFAVNKDKWHTKGDTGKSIKNALCEL